MGLVTPVAELLPQDTNLGCIQYGWLKINIKERMQYDRSWGRSETYFLRNGKIRMARSHKKHVLREADHSNKTGEIKNG